MSSTVLAIDLGSSSVRSALFDQAGRRLRSSTNTQHYAVTYSADGGAELSPNELLRATRHCLRRTWPGKGRSVAAICGSGFWHSLLGLDAKRRPLTPIFTWADSRADSDAAQLRRELSERRIQKRTGCMLRAPYWPAKLRWLHRTNRSLFRRVAFWVSPATWIFEQLFAANFTSHSMASGTGLYDLRRGHWNEELAALCHVRLDQLDPLNDHGLTSDHTPLSSAIGDGAASNLGSDADLRKAVAITFGTSGAVRMIVARASKPVLPAGLFQYVVDEKRNVLGGAISNGGNLRRWCLEQLQLKDEKLDRVRAADDTLVVLPFWVQERAPTWPEELRGSIVGLTAAHTAADIFRAATTSSFYRLADILDQLPARKRAEIIVSGGILKSPSSLKILADCLGRDLRICRELESSLRGAALHALEKLGHRPAQLAPGKLVRHSPRLAQPHRKRRQAQQELERLLAPRTTR